jgi:hypothetical protein
MWSKRASELWDIARISKLKWHTALSGCYKAPSDLSSLVTQNSSSNKNIATVGTLDVDINASRMVDFVVAGTFFVDLPSPTKMLEMSPGEWCMQPKHSECFFSPCLREGRR